MSIVKNMVSGMVAVFLVLMQFHVVGPGYYTMLAELNQTAYDNSLAGSNLQTYVPYFYDIFYWGYPALTAIGLIFSVAWIILWARRAYYSSGEYTL